MLGTMADSGKLRFSPHAEAPCSLIDKQRNSSTMSPTKEICINGRGPEQKVLLQLSAWEERRYSPRHKNMAPLNCYRLYKASINFIKLATQVRVIVQANCDRRLARKEFNLGSSISDVHVRNTDKRAARPEGRSPQSSVYQKLK